MENLYEDYQKDSTTVDPEWKKFFEGFDFALAKNGNGAVKTDGTQVSNEQLKKRIRSSSTHKKLS